MSVDALAKEEIVRMLNAGVTLRKVAYDAVREAERADDAHYEEMRKKAIFAGGDLSRLGQSILRKAAEIRHENAAAHAMELVAAARVAMNGACEAFCATPGEDQQMKECLAELQRVKTVAKEFGDVALALRCLEDEAYVYNYAGQTYQELQTLELAANIEKKPGIVVSVIGAQSRLIENANVSLVRATIAHDEELRKKRQENAEKGLAPEADEDCESDLMRKLRDMLLETNIKMWDHVCWLRKYAQSDEGKGKFDFDDFLMRYHTPVFAMCIYVGTVLSNPFLDSIRQEDIDQALDAFKLALNIADLMEDDENHCVAIAHRIRAFYGRSSTEEQKEMIRILNELEEKYHPKRDDAREVLRDIERQKTSIGDTRRGLSSEAQHLQGLLKERFQNLRKTDAPK